MRYMPSIETNMCVLWKTTWGNTTQLRKRTASSLSQMLIRTSARTTVKTNVNQGIQPNLCLKLQKYFCYSYHRLHKRTFCTCTRSKYTLVFSLDFCTYALQESLHSFPHCAWELQNIQITLLTRNLTSVLWAQPENNLDFWDSRSTSHRMKCPLSKHAWFILCVCRF